MDYSLVIINEVIPRTLNFEVNLYSLNHNSEYLQR